MAEHLTKIKAEQGPAATMLERHRASFHENGVQRILGPQAPLLRLGLVEKNAKGTVELCANTRLQPSPTSIAHCEELVGVVVGVALLGRDFAVAVDNGDGVDVDDVAVDGGGGAIDGGFSSPGADQSGSKASS